MNRRVLLVVDDEPRVRAFLREAFASEAMCVEEARCCEEALAITECLVPDLILLDLRMPRRDGLRTLACLAKVDHWMAHGPVRRPGAMARQGGCQ